MTKKKLKLYLRIYYLLFDASTRELKLAKLFFFQRDLGWFK